ncbi:hypothetical protein PO878_06590 [Iamia majanohamensis]|uniref:Uncharacterized protein n=1 Tax=Iamia majanohamensis TaxID=467976 RepID=A0AAF0BWY9_9ACTN|nr:hypothetical protein [Iamia majanohamensis]WCO68395.1 hypothetical protein PO878_06590 [Iamia majanohamensis]
MSDRGDGAGGPLVPEEIDCIDCGGRCGRITFPPEEGGWEPGDVVAYRCEDCLDRWDLVVPGGDEDPLDF